MSDSSKQSSTPNLINVEYGSVLLLGGTGTGKTYGLKSMLTTLLDKSSKICLYTINVKDSEYVEDFKKNHISTTFDKIDKIKPGSIVVVEDIIDLRPKEEIALRQMLNWEAHHKKLKIFCVSHNIFKTKLYNTISYFTFVMFTSSLGNLFVLTKCLGYFQLEPNIVESWVEKIKMFRGVMGVYIYFNVSQRKLYATNNLTKDEFSKPLGSSEEGTSEKVDQENKRLALQHRFDLFFKGRKNSQQAIAVFSILNQCLEPDLVKLLDLTLNFNSKEGIKGVSLVDYIDSLLDSESRPPSTAQLVLHNYVRERCTIPNIFLLNKNFE